MNELTIVLNPNSGEPLYEQIYAFIKKEIQGGHIPFQTKLPSTRTLSRYLQVSRSTVNLAYEQLMSEGYIEAVAGSGYYVAEIEQLLDAERSKGRPAISLHEEKKEVYAYDFSPRGIDLSNFPYNTWRRLNKDTLNDDHKELFAIGDPQGEPGLRQAIADYLYAARGADCSPEQIIIGAGNDYLLMLLDQMLDPKAVIGMETPTYKQAWRVFKSLGHQVKTAELDEYGMKMESLERIEADIVYVMPSHQYPTGIIMSIKRRLELLAWSRQKSSRYIIEDDYDSEFRYKGKPIPALQGFDKDEKVIYLGTFSRSIAPAIRVSYMVLPRPMIRTYQERCGFYACTVGRVDQEVLERFLKEGFYERHLNKMRALYRAKHDRLLAALKPIAKGFSISGEHAGMHLLLTAKKPIEESRLIDRAAEAGVKVYGISSYEIEERAGEAATIILGYANLDWHEIEEGVHRLQNAWSEFL